MPNTSSPLASLPKPIPSTTVPPPLLRSPMGDGNSAPAKKQSLKQDQLTSIDFYNDFSSSIRGQMSKLRDRAKVEAFKEAIDRVKHLVRGKVVLDVGSGVGILSLLAAKAGAKMVYSLELPGMADLAEQVAHLNTSRIQVVQGKVCEVELPVPMVDVIISDWMGHALFHESLISSVMDARDRWLKQDGLMLPDKATLHLSATSLRVAESKDWWGNVHGFDMGSVSVASLKEVEIGKLKDSDIVSDPCILAEFSLYNCKREQLLMSRNFALTARRDEYIGGVVIYWQVHFSHGEQRFSLDTAPEAGNSGGFRRNHRGPKQVVMGLQKPLTVERGEQLFGKITLKPDFTQHRSSLSMCLATSFNGSKSEESEEREYLL